MKSLEQIAQKMFTDFAMRKTGMWLDWRYLSTERKYAWMKEVADTFNACLDYLKEDLKPYAQPIGSATSYEKGFVAGQAHEAKRLEAKIDHLKTNIESQLANVEKRQD